MHAAVTDKYIVQDVCSYTMWSAIITDEHFHSYACVCVRLLRDCLFVTFKIRSMKNLLVQQISARGE